MLSISAALTGSSTSSPPWTRYDTGEGLFEKAVSLEPGNLQARHNLCVSIVDSGDLVGGERCLVEAARLATDKDHYIFKHLSIVRARLTASAGTPRSPSEDKDDS
ncbi:unnamed protein product [Schistocephalus solidus]|uniref:TPR_REGION domain-containing protein n=1 Tax=Schistocephalus solidus TaxID=70667 RepID=A0A183T2R2_SCHSO|nr:unnamed protein product [Schistocephalus solidus]